MFQYPFILNVTTDGGEELFGFEVFIDSSNSSETLDVDNKTTLNTFVFGDTHTIVVKKIGHEDDNKTDHVVIYPENVIVLNLPKRRVRKINLESRRLLEFESTCLLQYPLTINATTDGGQILDDFDVFIDGSNVTEALDTDNKTTINTFVFGDTHDVMVKKVGHESANQTSYVIQHPENTIDLNLPKKRVGVNNEKLESVIKVCRFSIHSS